MSDTVRPVELCQKRKFRVSAVAFLGFGMSLSLQNSGER